MRLSAVVTGKEAPIWDQFRREPRALGYVEDRDITYEYHVEEDDRPPLPLPSDLADLPVDISSASRAVQLRYYIIISAEHQP